MVGSSTAALLAVTALSFVMAGATTSCGKVDPKFIGFVHNFTDYSCIYIRKLNSTMDWASSKAKCESLGQHPYKMWRLVEPRTMDAFEKLAFMMKQEAERFWFWTGLVRQEYQSELPVDEWANASTWKWNSDNATLHSTFKGDPVPWEPSRKNLSENWLCGYVIRIQNPYCFGRPCNETVMSSNQVLVCESTNVSAKTTTSDSGSKWGPWTWFGIAMGIIGGVIFLQILGCVVIVLCINRLLNQAGACIMPASELDRLKERGKLMEEGMLTKKESSKTEMVDESSVPMPPGAKEESKSIRKLQSKSELLKEMKNTEAKVEAVQKVESMSVKKMQSKMASSPKEKRVEVSKSAVLKLEKMASKNPDEKT